MTRSLYLLNLHNYVYFCHTFLFFFYRLAVAVPTAPSITSHCESRCHLNAATLSLATPTSTAASTSSPGIWKARLGGWQPSFSPPVWLQWVDTTLWTRLVGWPSFVLRRTLLFVFLKQKTIAAKRRVLLVKQREEANQTIKVKNHRCLASININYLVFLVMLIRDWEINWSALFSWLEPSSTYEYILK